MEFTNLVKMPKARSVVAAAFLLLTQSVIASEPPAADKAANAVSATKRAVEFTYLKPLPGERENLKRFIVANWFAMDAIAVGQGLMVSYQLLDTGTDDGPWNVVVVVTYPNALGYSGIAPSFENIRRKHQTVLINAKGLKDFGKIVETRTLFEDVSAK